MEVNKEDVDSILMWANEISDKTNKSIAGIISRFTVANKELNDIEAAKVKVANELINKK